MIVPSSEATLLGRVWSSVAQGPCVATIRDGRVIDITSPAAPLVRDICEMADPVAYAREVVGVDIGSVEAFSANAGDLNNPHFLAPCDLQSVKACGVTFASSMVERVIEEQATGDPLKAQEIRSRIGARIGDSLSNIVPGSAEAAEVKQALIEEGLWSQYLEVGIGPDAEVFSKAQTLSSVGSGRSRLAPHLKVEQSGAGSGAGDFVQGTDCRGDAWQRRELARCRGALGVAA